MSSMFAQNKMQSLQLIAGTETGVPQVVSDTERFFQKSGLWYILSRNHEARSCKEAANRRSRLGHIGIPLFDELKSYLGDYVDSNGSKKLVMAHCHGNQSLDLKKLAKTLGATSPIERVNSKSKGPGQVEYGLANPVQALLQYGNEGFVQVFDTSLMVRETIPVSMMTNAGHLTWGIEFNCAELAKSLKAQMTVLIENVATPSLPLPTKCPIGILTGNAPDSGALLWRHINREVQSKLGSKFLGDLSYPEVYIHSLPHMGLTMGLSEREDQAWENIESAVLKLCGTGCKLIAIACNTTPYYADKIDKLCHANGAEFISIVDAVDKRLSHLNLSRVALFGIGYVNDFEIYSAYKKLSYRYEFVRPPEMALRRIEELAFQIKREGTSESSVQRLRDLINSYSENAPALLALTELSILMENRKDLRKSERAIIDALECYGTFVAETYMARIAPN